MAGKRSTIKWRTAAGSAFVAVGLLGCVPDSQTPTTTTMAPSLPATTRVSVASDGAQANAQSGYPRISADGRFVAFDSTASNLVPGDTNNKPDIFVHDRLTGTTERVSVASDGTQGNGSNQATAISADGRYVTFYSSSSNLVADDTNNIEDVFIHDRETGTTERVSVSTDGTQGDAASLRSSVSADGRYVAFMSRAKNLVPETTDNLYDIFVRDRVEGTTEMVSIASDRTPANGSNTSPVISGDGLYVAFVSAASNLVPGDTNNYIDVFVHNRFTGNTERVSVAWDGTEGNSAVSNDISMSSDGRFVGFSSYSSNLVPDDSNNDYDAFVHDRSTGITERVSITSDGGEANGTTLQSVVSPDGRFVGLYSLATNMVPDDTNGQYDVFIHDRVTGTTERVSVATDGTEGNGSSLGPSISTNGRFITFWSFASNLVPDDTNGYQEAFVRDRGA